MDKPLNKNTFYFFFLTAIVTVAITLLLVNIFEKKQEAQLYPSVLKQGEFELTRSL
jgi:hypothetical protein